MSSVVERKRKKTWEQKVRLVEDSFARSSQRAGFGREFYENLFFLHPPIKTYFARTDFEHQEKALLRGLRFLFEFLDESNENARAQILRLSHSHSIHGLKIHPHHYYYWREVVFYPVSFMISQYFSKSP